MPVVIQPRVNLIYFLPANKMQFLIPKKRRNEISIFFVHQTSKSNKTFLFLLFALSCLCLISMRILTKPLGVGRLNSKDEEKKMNSSQRKTIFALR